MKLIEKLSRRHLINSSDVFVIKGFTVYISYYLSKLESEQNENDREKSHELV